MSTTPDTIEIDASLITPVVERRPALAPLVGLASAPVALLPTWEPTVRGRRARRAWRLSAFALGVLFMLGARQSWAWLVPTALCFAFALVAPLRSERKKSWLARLAALGRRTAERSRPARLAHDGRRLLLYDGEKRARRVLTDRAFFVRSMRSASGDLVVRVAPKAKSPRKDSITVEFAGVSAPGDAEPATAREEFVRVEGGEAIAERLVE